MRIRQGEKPSTSVATTKKAVQSADLEVGGGDAGSASSPTKLGTNIAVGVPSPVQASNDDSEDEPFWNVILGLLLVLVCLMLYNELARHWKHRQQIFWDDHYLAAVRGSEEDWKFGWRLEDLEQRIASQRDLFQAESTILDGAFGGIVNRGKEWWHHQHPSVRKGYTPELEELTNNEVNAKAAGGGLDPESEKKERVARQLHQHVENDTNYVAISCNARPEYLLRVGPDDFRDVPTDRCQVFSGQRDGVGPLGSHAMWEVVPLGTKAVGLRAHSNGLFLKVVPPKSDDWNAPWKTEVVSPLPGLAERFQISGTMLYSELMHGYLQCSGDGLSEMVKGFPGETLYEDSDVYHFNMSRVTASELATARQLREASKHIEAVQTKQLRAALALRKATGAMASRNSKKAEAARDGAKIALVVPMTSRGTDMSAVEQSPFWFNLFASFMESVDWDNNKHVFTFYLGLDKGDSLYDTGDAWSDMRKAFAKNTRRALTWLNVNNHTQRSVLGEQLHLKLMDFEGTTGAPSQVVCGLVQQAYDDGIDYFFQVNDDTVIVSKDWAGSFIDELALNPIHPNLGITGPIDTNNDRILTHAFAHRTHIDIFGRFFPKSFKNWWSDDWISTVYGSMHTFRMYDVLITHNVQSQKTGAFNRYVIDSQAQYTLRRELQQGFVTINKWLKSKNLPVLPLPSICGYHPLIGDIYSKMMVTGVEAGAGTGSGEL